MISYTRLGSNGRLGNQMFQYAGPGGIAALRGWTWYIPPPDSYGDSNYGLFDCFEMSSVTPRISRLLIIRGRNQDSLTTINSFVKK